MTDQSGAAACCPPEAEAAMRRKYLSSFSLGCLNIYRISFQAKKESQGVTGRGCVNWVCFFIFTIKRSRGISPGLVWVCSLKSYMWYFFMLHLFWSAVHNKQPGDDRFQAAPLITSLINDFRSCPGCLIFLFYTFNRGVSPCNFHQQPI